MSEYLNDGQIIDGKKEDYWITYYANGNKRSQGAYRGGKKEGQWIQYFKNGNKKSEACFRNGLYEGHYISYHENGNRRYEGYYGEHQGNSYDGKKQGEWFIYDEDGERKNRKITYKNGSRAKADEFPPF